MFNRMIAAGSATVLTAGLAIADGFPLFEGRHADAATNLVGEFDKEAFYQT